MDELQQRSVDEVSRPSPAGVGLSDYDDAAVVAVGENNHVVLTTNFFPTPLAEPFLSGKVAALHSLSDVYAMGAEPTTAMAQIIIPGGSPREQKALLAELLHGSRVQFDKAGVALVGGHTTEGSETTIGFAVMGSPWGGRLCRKGTRPVDVGSRTTAAAATLLRSGDQLWVTKPLGTGVLLAAWRQARCQADWYDALLRSLLASVAQPARLAWVLGANWMTDVSGFGLAAHLLELLRGQQVTADIDLESLPVLPGSIQLATAGVVSSLSEGNREAAISRMEIPDSLSAHPKLPLLFDPQTSGGLLIALARNVSEEFGRISAGFFPQPIRIGEIRANGQAGVHLSDSSSAD